MPRLRQPVTAKKDELFDSTKISPPVEAEAEPKEPQLEAVADDEPEVVVEEPKPKKEEPKGDDASAALQKALEAIRRNEQLQKELEAAKLEAVENQQKILRAQRDTLDAEVIALDKTIQSANSEAEKAMLDYRNARDTGDTAAEAEALNRLTDAKASTKYFEHQKEALKEQRRELKKERQKAKEQRETQAQPQQQRELTVDEIIDKWNPPAAERQWLKERPEYVTDQGKVDALGFASRNLARRGINIGMAAFLPELEAELDRIENRQDKEQTRSDRSSSIMSAPVSREVPSGGTGQRQTPGRITLTRDQLEAAKVAGVTPAEYARQLIRLNEMKANGEYGERR